MKVRDIMTKNVITCSPEDTISSVLSKMKTHKVHQLPVVEKKQVLGMLTLDKIVRREIDPHATKVSSLMVYSPLISPEADMEEAIELILGSNLRALPVFDGELKGIVSETDLVKHAKASFDLGIAREAVFVEEKDNVGKVKKIMVYENLSRIPVVKEGKCIGIIGTLELIKILEAKQKFDAREASLRRGYKDKLNLDETLVTAVMREPATIKANAKPEQILEKLKQNEEVLVENGTLKIITPKDVLRLLVKPRKLAYVQITGLDKDDAPLAEKTHKEAELTLKKIYRVSEVQPLKIIVEKHQHGGKTKYSVHVQLPTQLGTFISTKSHGWNFVTVLQSALNNLEREFFRKYEKLRTQKKKNVLRKG